MFSKSPLNWVSYIDLEMNLRTIEHFKYNIEKVPTFQSPHEQMLNSAMLWNVGVGSFEPPNVPDHHWVWFQCQKKSHEQNTSVFLASSKNHFLSAAIYTLLIKQWWPRLWVYIVIIKQLFMQANFSSRVNIINNNVSSLLLARKLIFFLKVPIINKRLYA